MVEFLGLIPKGLNANRKNVKEYLRTPKELNINNLAIQV
jgi:hypothetical protein